MSSEATDLRTWPAFERLVAALQRRLDPAASVSWNERVKGRCSGASRQLDVVVRGRIGTAALMVVVECKEYADAVGIDVVESFLAKLNDVGGHQGIMVARTGYTRPALERAAGSGLTTCTLRPASDADWEGYLRSLHVKVVARVIVHEDLELEFVDGRRLRVSRFERLEDMNGKRTFVDRVIDAWLSNNEWKDGVPITLSLTPPAKLLRDEEQPGVAFIRCRPGWRDGFEIEQIFTNPEDWVLFQEKPEGPVVDEKVFFEFADLVRAAEDFR